MAKTREERLAYTREWRRRNAEKCRQRDRERYAKDGEAMRAAASERYAANKETILAQRKTPAAKERARLREAAPGRQKYRKRWAEENRDAVIASQERWREANRERERQRAKAFAKARPDLYAAHAAKRRAREVRATPLWADADAMAEFYAEAARKTRETGERHEVDHVVPLAGRNVCGLHCQQNLRVVRQAVNRTKSNRWDGERAAS